ncbi:MAG TPA: glycerate kinase, partial [Verrucomicrobia bacterium]|nr:glycerate kinase [Verrucomicrobiota bacterium]
MRSTDLKVLVVPDKFKGTLTAETITEIVGSEWRKQYPQDQLESIPMSDGGDGFGPIFGRNLKAASRWTSTFDAAHRSIRGEWWLSKNTGTAVIETARFIGLANLPSGKYHPFNLDTFGLGKVLRDVSSTGVHTCILGIGGSATNDGGFGMARALGWTFLDHHGKEIQQWTSLTKLSKIRRPRRIKLFPRTIVAVDVKNPLLGTEGASRIYGPQKGLKPENMALAEACLSRLVEVVSENTKRNLAERPGTGAAGGLGFGLAYFLIAALKPGFDIFSELTSLKERIQKVDLVITGEGAIDRSTLMGKCVGQVAALSRKQGKPCYAVTGHLKNRRLSEKHFTRIFCVSPDLTDIDSAMKRPKSYLRKLARDLLKAAKED